MRCTKLIYFLDNLELAETGVLVFDISFSQHDNKYKQVVLIKYIWLLRFITAESDLPIRSLNKILFSVDLANIYCSAADTSESFINRNS